MPALENIFSQKNLIDRYRTLPNDLQQAFFSMDVADHIYAIGQNAHLNIERIGILADMIGSFMLGLIAPQEFAVQLRTDLNIEAVAAEAITEQLNQQILSPLRESLKKMHGQRWEEDISAKNIKKGIPSAAPPAPPPQLRPTPPPSAVRPSMPQPPTPLPPPPSPQLTAPKPPPPTPLPTTLEARPAPTKLEPLIITPLPSPPRPPTAVRPSPRVERPETDKLETKPPPPPITKPISPVPASTPPAPVISPLGIRPAAEKTEIKPAQVLQSKTWAGEPPLPPAPPAAVVPPTPPQATPPPPAYQQIREAARREFEAFRESQVAKGLQVPKAPITKEALAKEIERFRSPTTPQPQKAPQATAPKLEPPLPERYTTDPYKEPIE